MEQIRSSKAIAVLICKRGIKTVSWNDLPEWGKAVTKSILETVKAKDPYTFFHCCRVGRNARLLSKAAGMNEYQQLVIEYAGLLHDVGKVGIPDNILFKPAKLTREEFIMMRLHPVKSLKVIKPLLFEQFFQDIAPGLELHHERLDGRGYPYGLDEKDISEMVRMVTIVDAVDAMVSTRPYRKGISHDMAVAEIKRHSGTQFDSHISQIYIDSHKFFAKEIKGIKVDEQMAQSLLLAA